MMQSRQSKGLKITAAVMGVLLLIAANPTAMDWKSQIKNYSYVAVELPTYNGGCGMTPDSTADQSALFQACLTTLGSNRKYIFPAGVYRLQNIEVGNGVATKSYTHIAASASPQTITVDDTTNIRVGDQLRIDGGFANGTPETVTVTAVSATSGPGTFTAIFSQAHGMQATVAQIVPDVPNTNNCLVEFVSPGTFYNFGGYWINFAGFADSSLNGKWQSQVPANQSDIADNKHVALPVRCTASAVGSPTAVFAYVVGKASTYNNVSIWGAGSGRGFPDPTTAGITEFRYPSTGTTGVGTYVLKFSEIAGGGMTGVLVNGASNAIAPGANCTGTVVARPLWVDTSEHMLFQDVSAACGNGGSASVVPIGTQSMPYAGYVWYVSSELDNISGTTGCYNNYHSISIGPTIAGAGGMGFDSDWNNGANGSGDTCSNHVRDLRIQWAGMAGHGLYLGKTDNDQFTGVNIATVGKINISAFTITNNVGSITTATPHWIAPGRSDGIFLTSLRNRRLETGYLATAVDSTHLTITIPTSLFNIPGGGASYTCPFGSGDECASTTSGLHPVGLYASDLPNGRVDSHLINQMNNTSGMVWNPIDPLSRVGGVTITDYLAEQRDSLENLGKLLVNGANGARMVNPIPIYTSKLTFINNGQNDNIDIGDSVFLVFTGLTNVGSITGFTNGYDGRLLMVFFSNNQQVTLRNQAGSTSGNQIFTNTLADVTLRTGPSSATFMYSAVMNSWVLMSYN